MGKTIEFEVKISRPITNTIETKKMLSKNLDRLLSSMPKHIKKTWVSISYTDKNGLKKIHERSV